MKKMYIYILLIIIVNPTIVYAQRGCCSHHGGVSGCNSYGRQKCNDGTLSPTCTCIPPAQDVYGCTDKNAINYNSNATKDDGSCIEKTNETSERRKVETHEAEEMTNVNKEEKDNNKSNSSEDDNESNNILYVGGIALIGSIIYLSIKR